MVTPDRELILTPLELVKTRKQDFLDADKYLPLGTVTIFSGRGSVGKTTLALHYVAHVSCGTLPGKYYGHPRNVIFLSHEDDPGTQLKPRLLAANVNEKNVYLLTVRTYFGDAHTDNMLSLTQDLELLKRAIAELDPALIVIDPLTSSIDGDLHKVQEVRRAITPLAHVAQVNDLAVIGLTHVNKGSAAVSDKMSGSHAFRDAARSVLLFARDDETQTTVVSLDKSNYARKEGDSFQFRLIDCEVPTDDGQTTNVARVELLGKSDVSVSDLWQREQDTSDRDEQNDTRAWLHAYLCDIGGSAASADIRKAANTEGHSWRTVQRAGKNLCVMKRTGYQGQSVWTLKEDESRELSINDTETPSRAICATPTETVTSDASGASEDPDPELQVF
jgi:hypothetical protein